MGALTAFLSPVGIATAVSGIGASVGISNGGVAALTGLSSTGLTAFSKKLQNKLTKHKQTYTLAITNTTRFVSLFQRPSMTMKSQTASLTLQKYHELKAAIRSAKNKQSEKPQPDIDEIKKQIRREERQNLQKKKYRLWPPSRSWI